MPLQPFSMGMQSSLQPLLWHWSTNSWYLDPFRSFASPVRSSQEMVNSINSTCFEEAGDCTMAAQTRWPLFTKNLSCIYIYIADGRQSVVETSRKKTRASFCASSQFSGLCCVYMYPCILAFGLSLVSYVIKIISVSAWQTVAVFPLCKKH